MGSAARGEDASADVSREFPNGDSYYGHWGAAWDVPHGTGCYVWADGSVYEGEWARGEKHGQGLFVWPSGARYKGEWARGQMQGGPGRYVWANGNEYFGEWEGGMMSGCGTFTWASGESYEGEWEGGVEHGVGAFRWRDGSRDGGIAASAINGHSHDAYDALTATVAAPVAVILSDVCGVEKAAASQILPGSFSMPKQAPDLISGSFNAGSVGSASARLVRRQTSGSVVGGAAAAGGGGGGPHGRPTGESRRGGRDEGRRETNLKGGDGAGNLEEREERMAIVSERRLEGHGRSAGMAGEGIKAAGASKGRAVREADMWRPLIGSDAESSQWGASSSAAVSSSTPSSVRPWGRPPLIPDRSPLLRTTLTMLLRPAPTCRSDRSHALPDRSLPVPGHPLSHFRKPSDDFFVGLSSANGSSTRGSPGSGKAMRKCMSGPLQPRVMQEREGGGAEDVD
ncbi:hypothetical protein CLOP_g20659 [Closterium sp. NIES-67]|nr:hypothetical protein CLOP_g20659 [Closterium sp. NIES-67]